jgi:hypothetical protein
MKTKGSRVDKNGNKRCAKCQETKPQEMFNRNRTAVDGREHYCKPCKKKQVSKWYEENPDYASMYREEYKKKTGDDGLTYHQRWYMQNRDNIIKKQKEYRERNKGKLKRWKDKNAYEAMREAEKKKRVPMWLSEDHKEEMKKIYRAREELSSDGVEYHVDHIVPLQGGNVCGFHAPWNMRIIPATKNMKKGFIYQGEDAWPYEVQVQMRRERWETMGKEWR